MLKKNLLQLIFFFFFISSYAQTVSIYVWTGAINIVNITTIYETAFGAGNVTVVIGNNSADFVNHDIVVFNQINNTTGTDANPYANVVLTDLISYIQTGGHVVLSTEGKRLANNDQFMSTVWNTLTGDAITETAPSATGTASPPRFHNSNGPWGLSPDALINPSTTTYASFGNLPALSVTHQRNTTPPTCANIEGLCAVYPSKPNLGNGTLYIQGEIQFPIYNAGVNVRNHAEALALFHFAMLTNDQVLLDQLNTWGNNPVGGDLLSDTTFCKGSLTPFTLTAPTSASYSWEDKIGTVLAISQTFNISDTGTYYLFTVGNPGECDGADSIKVTYDTLSFDTIMTPTCLNSTNGAIEVIGVSGQNITNPINYQVDNNPSTTNSIANGLGVGQYQIKVFDARGCADSMMVNVDTLPTPTVNFETDTVCVGNQTSFTDLTTPIGSVAQWEWRIDGTTSPSQNTTYTFINTSSFLVELKVIGNNGCIDSASQTIEMSPNPIVDFTAPLACENATINFTNLTTAGGKVFNSNFIFDWQFDDGGTSNLANPSHTYLNDGTYNVMLTATTDLGCTHDTTIQIDVFEKPVASFIGTTVCLNEITDFTDQSTIVTGNISDWKWLIDGSVFETQDPSYTYLQDGVKPVRLIVESSDGCFDTVNNNVTVYALPVADFSTDVSEIEITNSVVNFTNLSTGGLSYSWLFNGVETSMQQHPTHNFNIATTCGVYNNKLVVQNSDGCFDTVTKPINVIGNLLFYMPTAFSPDGNGINDEFKPSFTDLDEDGYTFQIFDKWGELLFETNEIAKAWNGMVSDKLVKQDVYVWKIKAKTRCKNEKSNYSGHFTLLR